MSTDEHEDKPGEDTTAALTKDILMPLFGENWAHIRHMEYYRMWCVNIYAVVVAGVVHALATGNLEPYLGYVAAFLVLFTISNLLITLKIEAIIENFVRANEKIAAVIDYVVRANGTIAAELDKLDKAELNEAGPKKKKKEPHPIAPIRTRNPPWNLIRFQWLFTVFYLLVLAGIIAVLIAVR